MVIYNFSNISLFIILGRRVAKRNLEKMKCLFKESLDIADMIITVNACNAGDKGFEILKKILKQMATDILVSTRFVKIYPKYFSDFSL